MRRLEACDPKLGPTMCGGKAATLARARAAGLPVLDGWVLGPDETIDDARGEAELAAALAALGGPETAFAVRSSADLEDAPGLSGAGVFESVIGARGLEGPAGVKAAIARVRASAAGEPARAYLAARGITRPVRMAVLVQPVATQPRLAVARSQPGGFLVEERAASEPEWGDVRARSLGREAPGPLAALLRACEALVGGPADVELALGDDPALDDGERALDDGERALGGDERALVLLQARPLTGAVEDAWPGGDVSPFTVEGNWQLDAEHNPQPLSAAQAGLVALVDALAVGPRQRVLGGYLYFAREPGRNLRPIPLAELRRRFTDEIEPDCRAQLEAAERAGTLEPALAAFAHVYRRYVSEVSPSLEQARAELDRLLRAQLGEPLAAHGALLAGLGGATLARDQALWALGRAAPDERPSLLAAYQARFGMLAPAWDVAVAPDDESPERVLAAAAALAAQPRSPEERHAEALAGAARAERALAARLDRPARLTLASLLPLVREVLPLAEDDDLLFFRAQRAVRRALQKWGRSSDLQISKWGRSSDLQISADSERSRWGRSSDLQISADSENPRTVPILKSEDLRTVPISPISGVPISGVPISGVFDLPLERVRAVAAQAGPLDVAMRAELRALADAGARARAAAARTPPPVAIDDGRPRWSVPAPPGAEVLRGHGTAGLARGRAFVVRSPESAPARLPPDAVLVVPALLPPLAYLLPGARALVTDHGGATSHGATLAREYGVPAVLGCRSATSLPDGADLWVDAHSGRVYRL